MAAKATAPAYGLAGLSDAFPPGFNPAGDMRAPELQIDVPQFSGMRGMSPPTPAAPAPASAGVLPPTPYDSLFAQADAQYKLPPGMLKSMANVESRFNPNATSPKGARGIMQFMPQTAARFGIAGRETDPAASIDAAGKYMQAHMNMFGGDIVKAIAAYNAGEGNVQKAGGIPAFAETQAYVPKVLAGFDNPLRGGGPSVSAPAPMPTESSFLERAGDVGISAVKGAIGVPEFVVGLADMVSGGHAGKALEQLGFRPEEAKAFLNSYYSDAQKSANQNVDDAKGFIAKAAAMVQNPSTIAHAIVEAIPAMGAGGLMARGLVGATKMAPWAAGAVGEGIVGGGLAAEQIRQQTPDGLTAPAQMGAAGMSGLGTAAFGALGGKLSQKLGVVDVDTMLAGGLGVEARQGFFKRLAMGGVSEGAFEEMPQSAQEQMWQNVAMGRPLMDGVPEAAAAGLVVGGAMGMVGGGLTRGPQQQAPAPEMETPPPPAPVDPMDPDAFVARQNALRQDNAPFVAEQNFRAGLGRMASANDAAIGAADINPVTGQPHTAMPGQSYDLFSFDPRDALRNPQLREEPTDPLRNRRQMEMNLDPTNPDILFGTDAAVSAGKTFNQMPITDDIRPGVIPGVGEAPVQEAPTWQGAVKAAFAQAKSKATKTRNDITAMETPEAAAAKIREKYSATGDRAPMKNTMTALDAAHTALTGMRVETYDAQSAEQEVVPPAATAPTKETQDGTTPPVPEAEKGQPPEGRPPQGPQGEGEGEGEGEVRKAKEKGPVTADEKYAAGWVLVSYPDGSAAWVPPKPKRTTKAAVAAVDKVDPDSLEADDPLAVAIRMFSSGDSFRVIGAALGVSQTTASNMLLAAGYVDADRESATDESEIVDPEEFEETDGGDGIPDTLDEISNDEELPSGARALVEKFGADVVSNAPNTGGVTSAANDYTTAAALKAALDAIPKALYTKVAATVPSFNKMNSAGKLHLLEIAKNKEADLTPEDVASAKSVSKATTLTREKQRYATELADAANLQQLTDERDKVTQLARELLRGEVSVAQDMVSLLKGANGAALRQQVRASFKVARAALSPQEFVADLVGRRFADQEDADDNTITDSIRAGRALWNSIDGAGDFDAMSQEEQVAFYHAAKDFDNPTTLHYIKGGFHGPTGVRQESTGTTGTIPASSGAGGAGDVQAGEGAGLSRGAKSPSVAVRKKRTVAPEAAGPSSQSEAGDNRPAQGTVTAKDDEPPLYRQGSVQEQATESITGKSRINALAISQLIQDVRAALDAEGLSSRTSVARAKINEVLNTAEHLLTRPHAGNVELAVKYLSGASTVAKSSMVEQMLRGNSDKAREAKRIGELVATIHRAAYVAAVEAVYAPILSKLPNAPAVHVVYSVADVPNADVRAALARDKTEATHGVYWRPTGEVFIVAENNGSLREAVRTLLHEVMGHAGLRAILPESQLRSLMADIYRTNPRIRALADKEIALFGYNKHTATEEVLANMAMDSRLPPSVVTRVLTAIREFLRSVGLVTEFTMSDVNYILSRAETALQEGPARTNEAATGELALYSQPTGAALDKFASSPSMPGRTTFMDGMHDFAADLIGDKGKAWAMNFMSLRNLQDMFGKRFPSLSRYVDIILTMGAKTHAIALEYAKVQEVMLGLHKPTQGMLLDQMTESTQLGIHPDLAFDDPKNKHVTDKAAWVKLHAQWNAMGAAQDGKKAQAAYIAARDLFRKNWEKRLKLIETKVDSIGLDAKEMAKWKASQAAWAKKLQGPYFPLTRFGDWVSVWKSDELTSAEALKDHKKVAELKQSGKHYKVAFMDSMSASKRIAAQWKDASGGSSYSQKRVEYATTNSAVDKVFLDKVEEQLTVALGTGKEGKAAVAAMKELYAYTMPDLSVMKRTLARRGVDGVDSKEMLRSFSRAGMADAFYMARLEYSDQALDQLQELREEDSPRKGGDHTVLAHMIKLHRVSLQRVDTPIQSALANASFVTMLGASPAFLTINAMQPWMITWPVMGGRHGMTKTAGALQSAYPDAFRMFKAMYKEQGWRFSIDMDAPEVKKAFSGPNGEAERLMIKSLLERGIIDIGIEHDLTAVAEGSEAGSNKFVRMFTAPAQYVETINRVTTALAAYRLEMAKENNDTTARAYAEKMVADTQLDYSAANAPYIMRPGVVPAGRLLFQFRKYQQGMIALLVKQLGKAMKGENETARKEAKNALFGLLATHMAMTGLAGLPVAFPIGVIATMIAQAWDDDDEPQPDIWWSNFLADFFGTTTAKVVHGGLPTLIGFDLQRMGLGNIVSPTPYVKPQGTLKETFQETALNLAPAEGLLTNWFAGADSFSKGEWSKGLTQVLPKAFADPIKAMKLADDGLRTARGNPVFSADDISGGELAMKAAGFQPAKLSTYYKAKSATEEYRNKALSVRDDLVNRWVESKGDPDERAKVMEDIQGYRERHKGQKGVDLTFAQLHKAGVADVKFARNTTASGITATRGEQWKRDMTRFAE